MIDPWTDGDSLRHYFGLVSTDLHFFVIMLAFGVLVAFLAALRGAEWI